jgi:hypothetical protein
MSALSIQPTYPIFTDIDGQPLENGYVWIGTTNLDPQTNPINVYWDKALTIQATQPIRTLGGYPSNSGTPARLYVNSDYSIRVQNRNGSTVYSALAATERYNSIVVDLTFTQTGTGAVTRTINAKMLEALPSPEDFGAVGDGVADDTTPMQELFDAHGQVRLLPGKIYSCSKLDINSDLEIFGYGSTLLHRANTAATGVGLLEMLGDDKLVIYGLRIDGNAVTQVGVTYANYNMVWCSIGSMELYECWIGNSKGHAVRTGNIDDFDASKFAHDIIVSQCKIIQSAVTNESGDSLRIERTQGGNNLFVDNYVYGGLSGMRSQLYCKNLKFYNNEVCYAWADVGITVAMGENFEIVGNYCHHNVNHGYEIDAVVNCRNTNNFAYRNGQSGFFASELGAAIYTNSSTFWGSIAEGYGTDYSNQTYTSPLVPNINTVHMYNVSIENAKADRLVGLDTDVYAYNYAKGNSTESTGSGDQGQLGIEGGSGLRSSNFIFNNIFVPRSGDAQAIYIYNYQQDATVSGNRVIGNVKLMALAANGMWDANRTNRYLQDSANYSVLLAPVNDSKSVTGFALTDTPSGGSSTYEFDGINAGGGGEKWIRFVARAAAASTVQVAVNLYLDATFVITVVADTPWNLTTDYTEFNLRIPASTSVGNRIVPQITNPNGNTIYIQELNIYLSVGE